MSVPNAEPALGKSWAETVKVKYSSHEMHTPWTLRRRQSPAKEMLTPSLHFGIVCFCHHLLQLPEPVGRHQTREACTVCPTQHPSLGSHTTAVQLEAAGAHRCNGAPSRTRASTRTWHWFLRHRFLFLTGTGWLTFPLLRDCTQKCVGTSFPPLGTLPTLGCVSFICLLCFPVMIINQICFCFAKEEDGGRE